MKKKNDRGYVSDRYETCYLLAGENVILSFFCLCYIIGIWMIIMGAFHIELKQKYGEISEHKMRKAENVEVILTLLI